MNIILSVSYFWPHISGLTLATKQLGEDLAARGHTVTVLAGGHDKTLPMRDTVNGVAVQRVPAVLKAGKAMLLPSLFFTALRAAGRADVVNICLPQADAALVALAARLRGCPVVLTYACSLTVPGALGKIVEYAVAASHTVAGLLAQKIFAHSSEYAEQSRFCRLFRRKLIFVDPSVPNLDPTGRVYRQPTPPYRIGFVGRLSREKGLTTLMQAAELLIQRMPEPFEVALCGPSELSRSESADAEWRRLLVRLGDRVRFVGKLGVEDLDRFFRSLDVLVLPSTDRIEAFGIVQVEAMVRGVPCVASDRPGIRQPIRRTGFGLTFEAGSADALAARIEDVLRGRFPNRPTPDTIRKEFSKDRVAETYLETFATVAGRR